MSFWSDSETMQEMRTRWASGRDKNWNTDAWILPQMGFVKMHCSCELHSQALANEMCIKKVTTK
jgi:hypothetical protein